MEEGRMEREWRKGGGGRGGGVEGRQLLYFWYAIKVVGSSSFTEKMEPKCTLHGSSASIMSVQFDQLVSVSLCV